MPVGRGKICDEADLVTAFPQYVTYAERKNGLQGIAYLHERMDLLKSFITNNYARTRDGGVLSTTVRVYEIYRGKPQLLYELKEGSNKKDNDLWKKKPKDRAVAIDEDDLAEALASIGRAQS